VVIDKDSDVIEQLLREIEVPYVEGDATQDQVLELAGISRARGLVTALDDDKSNAFVVLSARELAKKLNNPQLRTVARLNDDKQARKVRLAGADITISPKAAGGRRMVGVMLYPTVYSFLDEMLLAEQQTGQTLRLEEVFVARINNPALVELLKAGRLEVANIGQYTGLLVVAIKRSETTDNNHPYLYTPRGNTPLQWDDVLIVLGTPEERAKLKDEASVNPFEIWQSKAEGMWRNVERKFTRN
jgi:voltage-gated potassium channel